MSNEVESSSTLLAGLLVLAISLFCFSLFKHISYPLLWNDEGMTVMHGQRVLEFGYPKVHDGKNVVYDLRHPNKQLGIDEDSDAFIGGSSWGHYYYATIGLKLAEWTDDIYLKTGILRSGFALAGLLGLGLFGWGLAGFFEGRRQKRLFMILFCLLCLASIPLVLHMREVRYYALVILLNGLVFYVYTVHRYLGQINSWLYRIAVPLLLWMSFMVFTPNYFILGACLGLSEFAILLFGLRTAKREEKKGANELKAFFIQLIPFVVSLALVIPFLLFFRTFEISAELEAYNKANLWDFHYQDNLNTIFTFFSENDFIYLALLLKVGLIIFYKQVLQLISGSIFRNQLKLTGLLTLYFVVFFFLIARIPNFLFTRYFIGLQPILSAVILIDGFLLFKVLKAFPAQTYKAYGIGFALGVLATIGIALPKTLGLMGGHIHEMFNQYKGPHDFTIPHIQQKYGETKDLVLATNYAETVYMYYLDCRVIVGYVKYEIQKDAWETPDVLVYRPLWAWGSDKDVFARFQRNADYEETRFPVQDYRVNNIPELNFKPAIEHQFRTRYPNNPSEEVVIRTRSM